MIECIRLLKEVMRVSETLPLSGTVATVLTITLSQGVGLSSSIMPGH